MGRTINIITHGMTFKGILNDSATADALWNSLPIEASVNTWGDEIYFGIGVSAELEPGASAAVELYDLAYWPPGQAFCIFFGQTPVSRAGQIRAASEVNVIGRIEADAKDLKKVPGGKAIRLEKAE